MIGLPYSLPIIATISLVIVPVLFKYGPDVEDFVRLKKNSPELECKTILEQSYSDINSDPNISVSTKAVKAITPPIFYFPAMKLILDGIVYFLITVKFIQYFLCRMSRRIEKLESPGESGMFDDEKETRPTRNMFPLFDRIQQKALLDKMNEIKQLKSYLKLYQEWYECHKKECERIDADDPRISQIQIPSELNPQPESGQAYNQRQLLEGIISREKKIVSQSKKINVLMNCLKSLHHTIESLNNTYQSSYSEKDNAGDSSKGKIPNAEIAILCERVKHLIDYMGNCEDFNIEENEDVISEGTSDDELD